MSVQRLSVMCTQSEMETIVLTQKRGRGRIEANQGLNNKGPEDVCDVGAFGHKRCISIQPTLQSTVNESPYQC
jgi:hypothetical protein